MLEERKLNRIQQGSGSPDIEVCGLELVPQPGDGVVKDFVMRFLCAFS